MFNFRKLNLQKHLFRLVILLLPTQLAYHFWPDWSLLKGVRVDYFSPTLYLIDILVILYLVIQIKKGSENKIVIKNWFLFILLCFANLAYSTLFFNSLFHIFRLATYSFFVLSAVKSKLSYYFDFIKPLTVSLIFVCFVSFFQFLLQKNIGGVFYFLGERDVSVNSLAAPLFTFLGGEMLRVQSTFSHPNSFAGFVFVSAVLIFFAKFPQKDKKYKYLVLLSSIVAVLISYSNAVFLTIFITILLIVIKRYYPDFVKKIVLVLPLFVVFMSLLFSTASENLIKRGVVYKENFQLRVELASFSNRLIRKNTLFGVGSNNFIFQLSKNPPLIKSVQFLQPVHNIYLLIFSEWGIVGVLVFMYIALQALLRQQETNELKIALSAIFFLGLFDHYWITLNQNIFLFIIVLVFSLNWQRTIKH